jgi:hypothetical protein
MWDLEKQAVVRTSSVSWVKNLIDTDLINTDMIDRSITSADVDPQDQLIITKPNRTSDQSRGEHHEEEEEDDRTDHIDHDTALPELGTPLNIDIPLPDDQADGYWSCDDTAPRHQEICSHRHKGQPTLERSARVRRSTRQTALVSIYDQRAICSAFAQQLVEPKQAYQLPAEPKNHKAAIEHPHAKEWMGAEQVEYASHDENGTWTYITRDQVVGRALPTK